MTRCTGDWLFATAADGVEMGDQRLEGGLGVGDSLLHDFDARRTDGSNALIFNSDYMFPLVSSAAALVTGASANGRISWRLPDGRTYADWEECQTADAKISPE